MPRMNKQIQQKPVGQIAITKFTKLTNTETFIEYLFIFKYSLN